VKFTVDEITCEKSVDEHDYSAHLLNVLRSFGIVCIELLLLAGALITLELWWVSLGLSGTSFVLAFELDNKFSEKTRKLRDKRLADGKKKIHALISKATKAKPKQIDGVTNEIFDMALYRENAEEPVHDSDAIVDYFYFDAFLFLGSLLVRAGMDYGLLTQIFGSIESYLFVVGVIVFAGISYKARKLMKLVRNEKTA
jgi:hypothetical protein